MEKFGLIGKMITETEMRDDLCKIMREAAALMKNAPGCESYVVHLDRQDAGVIWITEIWKDEESHDQSLLIDGVGELIQKARPMIRGMEGNRLITLLP